MQCTHRTGFSLIELLVVVAIIGVLLALLLPAVQAARESARRMTCSAHVQQIGLALQHYASARGALPPGAILARVISGRTYQASGTADYDPWEEANGSSAGWHGTSWMLQILPFLEQNALYDQWDFKKSVSGNQAQAAVDIGIFYCPTRRSEIRPKDKHIMFPRWARDANSYDGWTAGGNDYAGCIGAQNAFTNPTTSNLKHRLFCGPTYVYDQPPSGVAPTGAKFCLAGVFIPNIATKPNYITDGMSNTIAIGEVSRSQWRAPAPAGQNDNYWGPCHTNIDGWAIAGTNTLFDTAKPFNPTNPDAMNDQGQQGAFSNDYHESAGSDHGGGAYFGLADGSVHFINKTIDPTVYACLGSVADGQPSQVP
jgi:prepilin-type N-terminal cleavage/methylation domain-containing protein